MAVQKSTIAVAILAMAFGLTLANPAPGGDHKGMMFESKCGTEDWKPLDKKQDFHEAVEACFNKSGDASAKHDICQSICAAQKIGILDDKGAVVMTAVTTKIEAVAPASKVDALKKGFEDCVKQHGSSLDPTKCDSYKPIKECGLKVFTTVCEWKEQAKTSR